MATRTLTQRVTALESKVRKLAAPRLDITGSSGSVALVSIAPPAADAPAPRFIKVSTDGKLLPDTAADWSGVYVPAAKLIVARRTSAKRYTFTAGNAACTEMDLCGAKAERSISLREFVNHLLEDGRTAPAVDPSFFTIDDTYRWIWTCDECAPSGFAWYVNLFNGFSDRDYRYYELRVLAVRAGQFSGFGSDR